MTKSNTKSKKGFTIIEVVLVLAIAGLIFLMVFVALPALQRSQRDTQRRDDVARVSTAITQYQSNNKGNLPNDASRFIENYLRVGGDEFADPSGNEYEIDILEGSGEARNDYASGDYTITIYTGAVCDEEAATASNRSRDYAVVYKLEGSGSYCVGSSNADN